MKRVFLIMGLILSFHTAVRADEILMAVRTAEENPQYCTYWLSVRERKLESFRLNGIWIPGNEGFRVAGVTRKTYHESWTEDHLWITKPGQEPEWDESEVPGEETEGTKYVTILFAGDNWVSTEVSSGGYSMGAAHPWAYNILEVRKWDELNGGVLSINTVFGGKAVEKLKQGSENYFKNLSPQKRKEMKESLNPEPDESSWGIIRRRGEWVCRGRLTYNCEANRGVYADFNTGIFLPQSGTGSGGLAVPWEKIKAKTAEASDSFSPSDGKWVAILTKKALTVRWVNGNSIGEPLGSIKLEKPAAIVGLFHRDGSGDEWEKILKEYKDK